MKCQNLFSGKIKNKYQFVVCWISLESGKDEMGSAKWKPAKWVLEVSADTDRYDQPALPYIVTSRHGQFTESIDTTIGIGRASVWWHLADVQDSLTLFISNKWAVVLALTTAESIRLLGTKYPGGSFTFLTVTKEGILRFDSHVFL